MTQQINQFTHSLQRAAAISKLFYVFSFIISEDSILANKHTKYQPSVALKSRTIKLYRRFIMNYFGENVFPCSYRTFLKITSP